MDWPQQVSVSPVHTSPQGRSAGGGEGRWVSEWAPPAPGSRAGTQARGTVRTPPPGKTPRPISKYKIKIINSASLNI